MNCHFIVAQSEVPWYKLFKVLAIEKFSSIKLKSGPHSIEFESLNLCSHTCLRATSAPLKAVMVAPASERRQGSDDLDNIKHILEKIKMQI